MSTAYCVGYIDKATGQVMGASIFSEPTPTCSFKHHTFVVFEIGGATYGEAKDHAARHLHDGIYNWLGPISTAGSRVGRKRIDPASIVEAG